MIRSTILFTLVVLLAFFGYFFLNQPQTKPTDERAKQAAMRVGDLVLEEGQAGVIRMNIVANLGVDTARFLHVYCNNGRVLIYGLAPEGVTADALTQIARQMPNAQHVDVQITPRPDYVAALGATGDGAGEMPAVDSTQPPQPVAAPERDRPSRRRER
ncbi:MAG: BON domain-containing protein [Phycisphaerales bacterium]|nr:BON domain-containing protein [Phycisphaerales bacterium]